MKLTRAIAVSLFLLALASELCAQMDSQRSRVKPLVDEAFDREADKDFKRAVELYTDAIKIDPQDGALFRHRAHAHYIAGNPKEAVADCDAAIKLGEIGAEVYSTRGGAHLDIDRLDEAVADFSKAIELNPGLGHCYVGRATAYARLGQIEKGIDDYTTLIKLAPTSIKAIELRAQLYELKRDHAKAISDYTRIIEMAPEHVDVIAKRASCYRRTGENDKAYKDFSSAISLRPDSIELLHDRANCLWVLQKYTQAAADYERMLKLDANNEYAKLGWVECVAHAGDKKRAVREANRLVEANASALRYTLRGSIFYLFGDYEEAIEDYTRGITLDPEDAYYYQERGNAYRDSGRLDKAFEDYNTALDMDAFNEDWVIWIDRAICHGRAKDVKSALSDFNQAEQLGGEISHVAADIRYQRGKMFFHLGRYDEAIKDLTAAIEHEKNRAGARFYRGYAHFKKGQLEKADLDRTEAAVLDDQFKGKRYE